MIIWKKNSAADGDLHEYIFSVTKIYYPLMIDSMCSPSMSHVIGEMAIVMRQYSNGLLVFVLPGILEPLRGQLGVPCGVLNVAMAQPLLNGSCVVPIVGQLRGRLRSPRSPVSDEAERPCRRFRKGAALPGGTPCGQRRAGPSSATSAPGRPRATSSTPCSCP